MNTNISLDGRTIAIQKWWVKNENRNTVLMKITLTSNSYNDKTRIR